MSFVVLSLTSIRNNVWILRHKTIDPLICSAFCHQSLIVKKRLTNVKSHVMFHALDILPEQFRECNDSLELNPRDLELFGEKNINAVEAVLFKQWN